MVKMMNYEFKMMNLRSAICDLRLHGRLRVLALGAALALLFATYNSPFTIAFAQQPQAPAGTPLYSVNAKYVNGMAPGYWATAGSGLSLNVSAGTAYCGNPPLPVSYPGGSLTLTASATNYIYLDPANSCTPTASASAFTTGDIPIATVITGTASITSIADDRTWFTSTPASGSTPPGGSNTQFQVNNSGAFGGAANATYNSTTGASTFILQDKGGQVFNVRAYGAAGDGVTDDIPAFQAALNAAVAAGGGTIEFPPASKCYLINSTMNLTNLTVPIALHGNGKVSAVCGNTGLADNGAMIDESGSGGILLSNMFFVSDTARLPAGVTLANPSQIGILYGRTPTNAGAQQNDAINTYFFLPVHASGSPSFGWYNCGSELDTWVGGNVQADNPVVLTLTNQYNLNSTLAPWITQSAHSAANCQSTTEIHMMGTDFQTSGLGPGIEIDGSTDDSFDGHVYNLSQGSSYSGSLSQYAVQIDYYGGRVYNLNFKFRQEGFPGFLKVNSAEVDDSIFQGSTVPGPTPPASIVEFTNDIGVYKGLKFLIDSGSGAAITTPAAYDANLVASPNEGVGVLDDVTFECGRYTDCVNIPYGQYQPGSWALYVANIHVIASAANATPTVSFTKEASATANPSPFTTPITTPAIGLNAFPVTYSNGGTQQANSHIVTGYVGMAAGTVTVGLTGSAAFTSSSTYQCTGTDATAIAAVDVIKGSGTSVTFNGTGADVVEFICVGN